MDTTSFSASHPTSGVTFQHRDFCLFVRYLQWSLEHSAEMAQTYLRLLEMAPTDDEAERIETMLREENKHFGLFESMYKELRGHTPKVRPEPVFFETYRDGLQAAVHRERTAIKQFRDTYLLTPSPRIRDVFFLTLYDKWDHIVSLLLMDR
ncbi:ferritin-like domain-containing protein [Paenibacillus thalictri]|uniref:Ferritin-like domain-containing protein n=1 Tax=Paenibacillus thalictri TaxID=2527873 RepID=A0A4Q9DZ76_9BACL|nr:ferritin-like domain-containing protein [Paenibacillus thalictri]TBL81736.1 ferritin-like domain-containing protein [Paenibacillus thalictri]